MDVPLADPLWKATVDALALLRRAGLPPTPLTFGFAHAIVTGAATRAVRALEEAHAQGRGLSEAQWVRLFREEAGAGALELARAIGDRIDAQIHRLVETIAHQRPATDRLATAVSPHGARQERQCPHARHGTPSAPRGKQHGQHPEPAPRSGLRRGPGEPRRALPPTRQRHGGVATRRLDRGGEPRRLRASRDARVCALASPRAPPRRRRRALARRRSARRGARR